MESEGPSEEGKDEGTEEDLQEEERRAQLKDLEPHRKKEELDSVEVKREVLQAGKTRTERAGVPRDLNLKKIGSQGKEKSRLERNVLRRLL
jgi:hypothetical protein